MKDVSTLFLKTAVIVLSLPMILFCMFLIPEIGQATAVKFSTLEAICEALDCQSGDSLAYEKNNDGDL